MRISSSMALLKKCGFYLRVCNFYCYHNTHSPSWWEISKIIIIHFGFNKLDILVHLQILPSHTCLHFLTTYECIKCKAYYRTFINTQLLSFCHSKENSLFVSVSHVLIHGNILFLNPQLIHTLGSSCVIIFQQLFQNVFVV